MFALPSVDLSTRTTDAGVFVAVPLHRAGDMVAKTDNSQRGPTAPDADEASMEFRWIAVLALWTLLSGPILTQPGPPPVTASQNGGSYFTTPANHSLPAAATRR
jgi:hypothetical protein